MPHTLPAHPGHFGRLSYHDGRQHQKVGPWLDMGAPAEALRTARDVQHQHANRELIIDVLPVKAWKVRGMPVKVVQTLELKDYMNGLAGTEAGATLPQPTTMEPQSYHSAAPDFAPTTQAVVLRPQPTAQQPPANMDHMGQFLFNQQEQRLLEARNEAWELRERLRVSDEEKRKLKDQLDDSKIELRYKEREHKHNIKDREREIREEYESQEPKASGLAGLTEVMSNPQHPMAGLLGMVLTKVLGGAPGAPGAAPAGEGAQLTGTYTARMVEVLDGIGAILPSEEVGVKVYTALVRILPREDGLMQLQNMAGLGMADAAY